MNFHIHKRLIIIISALLGLIIVLLGFAFVSTYRKVAPDRVINSDRLSHFGKEHTTLGASDVGSIAPWMTFDYINHVFVLPPDYLQTGLGITDSKYPALTLSHYAKDSGIDADTLTVKVQNAVRDYFAAQTTSQ